MKYNRGGRLAMLGIDPAQTNLVYAFDIEALIKLKSTSTPLEGHPAKDLPDDYKGWVEVTQKQRESIERHIGKSYLFRLTGRGGNEHSICYVPPKIWRKMIDDDDWQWIVAICDVSEVYTQTRLQSQQPEAVVPVLDDSDSERGQPKPRKPKVKAKDRRRRDRRRNGS